MKKFVKQNKYFILAIALFVHWLYEVLLFDGTGLSSSARHDSYVVLHPFTIAYLVLTSIKQRNENKRK